MSLFVVIVSICNDCKLFENFPAFFTGPLEEGDPLILFRDVISFRLEVLIKMTMGTFYESFLRWPKNFLEHGFEPHRLRFYRQNRKPANETRPISGEGYDSMLMKVFLVKEQIDILDYWSLKLEKEYRIRGTVPLELWTQVMDSIR